MKDVIKSPGLLDRDTGCIILCILGLGRKHFFTFREIKTFTKGVTVFAKFCIFFAKVFTETFREK
jgi:hypothetical protein